MRIYLPTRTHIVNGQRRKMGRHRPIDGAPHPRLKLSNYMAKSIPDPPKVGNYITAASAPVVNQMYLNNQLGDCVIAAMCKVVGVMQANAGQKPTIFTNQQVINLYSAIGGYVPGNPATDNGCDEVTALNYWLNTGCPAGANKLTAWMAVNPQDQQEYKTALWLFENLYFGIECPDAYVNVQGNGFVWGPGQPDPADGHAVPGFGWTPKGIKIATWGLWGTFLDRAINEIVSTPYGGELYCVLSKTSINKATQKCPVGLDWSQMIADYDSLFGANVPTGQLRPRMM
jgi:hypothetical protein